MIDAICQRFNIHDQCRICLTGGRKISIETQSLCREIGKEISRDPRATIITGGFKNNKKDSNTPSADYAFVQGAQAVLTTSEAERKRLVTLLPEKDLDSIERFETGRVYRLPAHNLQARRFSMVRYSDVILSVEGAAGTKQIIDLALALGKPVLPIAFTGGASQKRWEEYRNTIIDRFCLSTEIIDFIENTKLNADNIPTIELVAKKIVSIIMKPIDKNCFVIMPFSKTKSCSEEEWTDIFLNMIKPAVEGTNTGIKCERADFHSGNNILKGILTKLHQSDIVIADLTDRNANVYYELGIRQALRDNTILITQDLNHVPFDLNTFSVIEYSTSTAASRKSFQDLLKKNVEAIHSGDWTISPVRDYLSIVEGTDERKRT